MQTEQSNTISRISFLNSKQSEIQETEKKIILEANDYNQSDSIQKLIDSTSQSVLKKFSHYSARKNQTQASLSSLKSLSSNPSPEKFLSVRVKDFRKRMDKNMEVFQNVCQLKFGGIEGIKQEMYKHAISKEQLAKYYAQMVRSNFILPEIKKPTPSQSTDRLFLKRSKSQKTIQQKKPRLNLKNKWFINPEERFRQKVSVKVYDWKSDKGISDFFKKNSDLKLPNKAGLEMIDHVQKAHKRPPICCQSNRLLIN